VKKVAVVAFVERIHLVVDVRDQQILEAVAVDVGCIDAHAGARDSRSSRTRRRLSGRLLPAPAFPDSGRGSSGRVSLATNRSRRPSLLTSVATAPRALPSA